ncbi:hypothetical protein LshimejAT787_0100160 [Lyophyllum shimeji]|uniref:Uncharacterized protein n=1 Tax=Lyophyllum shimeji TaxID=47721 RepID=A0A9P3UJB5_LYOSH|nr:hypothetical protein LshimejAT787_0100160 [Lyophyllum shimeji]
MHEEHSRNVGTNIVFQTPRILATADRASLERPHPCPSYSTRIAASSNASPSSQTGTGHVLQDLRLRSMMPPSRRALGQAQAQPSYLLEPTTLRPGSSRLTPPSTTTTPTTNDTVALPARGASSPSSVFSSTPSPHSQHDPPQEADPGPVHLRDETGSESRPR